MSRKQKLILVGLMLVLVAVFAGVYWFAIVEPEVDRNVQAVKDSIADLEATTQSKILDIQLNRMSTDAAELRQTLTPP